MNWKPQIFKPRWKSKDESVRREAVASGQEPELLAELTDISRTDESPSVRQAALRRVNDLRILSDAVRDDTDPATRSLAEERLRQLVAATDETRVAVAERLAVLTDTADRKLLEIAAVQAPETELRQAALGRIERQGFLGDRAIADPDPEIRRFAAARIDQESTLRRVIDATRTSDKALHQALSARLHQQLLAAGDVAATQREALEICTVLETLLLQDPADRDYSIERLEARWSALKGPPGAGLEQRFRHDIERLKAPATPPPDPNKAPDRQAPEAEAEPVTAPEAVAASPAEIPDATQTAPEVDLRLQEALQSIRDYHSGSRGHYKARRIDQLDKNWLAAIEAAGSSAVAGQELAQEARQLLLGMREELHQADEALAAELQQARNQIEALQKALTDGELHKALELRAGLQRVGKRAGKDNRWKAIQADLNASLPRLRELRDWQHWANDKVRKRLIDDMEALPTTGLHPDALLERLQVLQQEWKSLEASEQIPGDRHYAAAPWMWRRFNAAGRKAFEATKPFLDKRSEVQSKRLEGMQADLERFKQTAAADPLDPAALRAALQSLREDLRDLSEIPARARPKIAKKLKTALERGNAAQKSQYDTIEAQKLKLIREAQQLSHETDRGAAIQRAKALQAQWKEAGRLWRSRENQLWKEFRSPIDPLFESLDEDRKAEQKARAEVSAAQDALFKELTEILELPDEELVAQHGRVLGLADQWRNHPRAHPRLQQKFQDTMDRYRERERTWQKAAEQRQRDRLWQRADLVHAAETASALGVADAGKTDHLSKQWAEAGTISASEERALERRFQAALGGQAPQADADGSICETARKICINLEFLAGLPSPDEEKSLRMQYQVERLSSAMSGERARQSAVEEARQLESQWLELAWFPDPDHSELRARAQAALRELSESHIVK